MKKIFVAAGLIVLAGTVASAQVTNGSFESGLSGWTASGIATTVTSDATGGGPNCPATYLPTNGSLFGRVTGSTVNIYSTLSQTFSATSGQTLGFNAYYKCTDGSSFADDGAVLVNGVAQFGPFGCNTVGSSGCSGPAFSNSTAALVAGSNSIVAQVRNTGDSAVSPRLGLDNVAIQGGGGGGSCDLAPVLAAIAKLETKADAAAAAIAKIETKADAAAAAIAKLETKSDQITTDIAVMKALVIALDAYTREIGCETMDLLLTPEGRRCSTTQGCGHGDFPMGIEGSGPDTGCKPNQ